MVQKALLALSFNLSTGVGEADGEPLIELTAVFLESRHGYVGFVEELPGVNSHGRTLEEARDMLGHVAMAVFDAERARAEEFISGKECVREPLVLSRSPGVSASATGP